MIGLDSTQEDDIDTNAYVSLNALKKSSREIRACAQIDRNVEPLIRG